MAKKTEDKKIAPTDRRRWKIGSVIIILVLTLFIGLVVSYFYVGSPKEIIAVADRFKPEVGWQLEQERIEPPRNSCLTFKCPSVVRAWIIPQEMNREQFERIAYLGNDKLFTAKDCFEKSERGSIIELCSASAVINGYTVRLHYYGSTPTSKPSITLAVE